RAPHAWLGDGRSILDLFGRGFTLLVFASNRADKSAFASAAKKVGLPLEVIGLNESEAREIYERPLVLVRPDGHVAWRGASVPADAAQVLDRVRGAQL
ncbi:MAG TPA: 2-polyprenyl-6-methoxyphenol hydroxylase, partial [Candidatus Binatia bacterium]